MPPDAAGVGEEAVEATGAEGEREEFGGEEVGCRVEEEVFVAGSLLVGFRMLGKGEDTIGGKVMIEVPLNCVDGSGGL